LTDYQKTPTAQYLSQFAAKVVARFIAQLGKSLPCEVVSVAGPIVTVKFNVTSQYTLPQVTIPIFGPEYVRYPTQVGDLGVCFPVDTGIGPTTGLGTGTPVLSQKQGNLSNLVFFPVGSKSWSATDDPRAVVIYGPSGVILRTVLKDSVLTVATGKMTLKAALIELEGAVQITGTVSGDGAGGGVVNFGSTNVLTTGTATASTVTGTSDVVGGGKSLKTHKHSGVATGSSVTGPPV
jgi:hypothetical protein